MTLSVVMGALIRVMCGCGLRGAHDPACGHGGTHENEALTSLPDGPLTFISIGTCCCEAEAYLSLQLNGPCSKP